MKYLVIGSDGPGFSSPEKASELLNTIILPTFEILNQLEEDKKILAGGLPVGERTLAFIIEAASNEELDKLLRSLPIWGVLQWTVSPLTSFAARANRDAKGF